VILSSLYGPWVGVSGRVEASCPLAFASREAAQAGLSRLKGQRVGTVQLSEWLLLVLLCAMVTGAVVCVLDLASVGH
jgi:hypothetical protein